MDILNDIVLPLATSPWIYPITLFCVALDGLFPPLPSEALVVALAALAASNGVPDLWLLVLIATAGAFLGDHLAFGIGRAIGRSRLDRIRYKPFLRLLGWAENGLNTRPGTLLLTARYVPVGRVAVNITAGATGFRWLRFMPWCGLASLLWAAYTVGIGYFTGRWFDVNPLLGMVIAMVLALALGWLMDVMIGVIKARFWRSEAGETAPGPEPRQAP